MDRRDGAVTLAVVGAGNRGRQYAGLAVRHGRARVVAVAEPLPARREAFARAHDVPADAVFDDWRTLAARPKLADAVIVATQDRDHVGPAVALAGAGYDILLEKPIAPTEGEAETIVAAAERAGVRLAVCHVLRYTPHTRLVRRLLDEGRIGDIVTVQHLEPIGWWHFAHSYVRGNWRTGTPMLLAKACHDVDWLQYLVGRRAVRVSSFGGLFHFRPDRAPSGAGERCVSCAAEPTCPYSAVRLYPSFLGDPDRERWPLATVVDEPTAAAVDAALREGPYGRCVYTCDNDAVDHQVVTIEYEGGVTASLTATAFTPMSDRRTRVMGTRGYLDTDGRTVRVYDFLTAGEEAFEVGAGTDASAARGHGGGDAGLVDAFLAALTTDPARITTGPAESMASHRVVWAAERARREGTVVDL
ncbi:Gfo/Idh/MocA family protein [Virgisporangium ochraceum]|uniref:Streptomycin biosynthesis protein StrI n=1 Tax=Virgisporangium ochraceum TaxID=65505 RepID=A0A8J4EIZ7_9ACTN|nr:Gfo/Idh/MocA family oxidoreductase [Virgisporangium ochraceum]GIJ73767.1 streptomycin biosynthesis protein StrI [Virgisporangium ochraceum]